MFGRLNINFNSHAHVERDYRFSTLALYHANFNSHAHVERDYNLIIGQRSNGISTHTLTWSVTCYIIIIFCHFFISTHTLTWSVTTTLKGVAGKEVISTHTLTWSVTPYATIYKSSHKFQLTRSRGA